MDNDAPARDTQPAGKPPSRPGSENEARHEKVGLYVLAGLVLSFSALGAYGILIDNGPLEVLAFCGAMPTLFGFFVLLGMHLTWGD
jgi:hypothetical protein